MRSFLMIITIALTFFSNRAFSFCVYTKSTFGINVSTMYSTVKVGHDGYPGNFSKSYVVDPQTTFPPACWNWQAVKKHYHQKNKGDTLPLKIEASGCQFGCVLTSVKGLKLPNDGYVEITFGANNKKPLGYYFVQVYSSENKLLQQATGYLGSVR